MKLETLKSSKFDSFQSKKITSLKEIVGGTYYLYNTSTHISNGVGDGTDCAKWTMETNSHAYDGACKDITVDPVDPKNVNISLDLIAINDGETNATILTNLSFDGSC